jgi:signal transduction histidine kinase
MIEQILDLTRSRLVGGLQLVPTSLDLRTMLVEVIEELRTAHPSRTIELRCPGLLGVWDADRLEQVFSNLVGNAVHHSPAGTPVTVTARQEGEDIHVEVHNDGPPIPEALRGELFSPFRRGARDSRTSVTAGLGLGLFISSEIVTAHGGTITVESTASEGTTFRVSLPLTVGQPLESKKASGE